MAENRPAGGAELLPVPLAGRPAIGVAEMPGTLPGGDDPLASMESNDPDSADVLLATPLTSPLCEAYQRQWDEDREMCHRLTERLERKPIMEEPEPLPMMVVRFLRSLAFGDGPILPAGAVTRIDEASALDMLERWPERIECATEEELREYDARKAELDLNEVAGQAVPLADVPAPPRIVRFLDNADGTINGRPILRGTIAEIEEAHAWDLYKYRTFGIQELGAKVEWATEAELRAYEALMLEADKNEVVTASDPLSQQLGMVPLETPKLIVRFIRGGWASDKRSCGIGEVWPVEKEKAMRQLLEKEPVVELATPEELKRDRDLVNQIREAKKQSDMMGEPQRFFIRFRMRGTHPKGHTCEPGEVWEVDEDHAHSLCRGRSPACEFASEAVLNEFRAKRSGEPTAVEPVEQGQTGAGGKTVKPKKSTAGSEARAKLISALTNHHHYSNGGCGEFLPIGVNKLARQADVAPSTALAFFTKQFQGHKNYQRGCGESSTLIAVLKLLNDEFTPGMLIPGVDRKQPDADED